MWVIFMDYDSSYSCWEMMNCDNLDCPARHEPETPCWEIAKRDDIYQNNVKNCKVCVVYILKAEAAAVALNKIKKLTVQREFWERLGSRHRNCILSGNATG